MSEKLDDIIRCRQIMVEVVDERKRQMTAEGWTPPHDDAHRAGQLAGAAACYAMNDLSIRNVELRHRVTSLLRDLWPWAQHWWKPSSPRRNLIKAAALIIAEIERLDRNAA
jgi:hypothetical protein